MSARYGLPASFSCCRCCPCWLPYAAVVTVVRPTAAVIRILALPEHAVQSGERPLAAPLPLDLARARLQAAVEAIIERNPNAFRPKIAASPGLGADASVKHNKGCHCKKSG